MRGEKKAAGSNVAEPATAADDPAHQITDHVRHGTTILFAALTVLDGTVIGHCQPRQRHMEFLALLERVDGVVLRREGHLILNSYSTRKHPRV